MNNILKTVAEYSKLRISLDDININNYVTTDNLLQNKLGKVSAEKMPQQTSNNVTRFDKGDILIGNIRPYLKKIWLAKYTGGSSSDVLTFKVKKGFNSTFVYYSLFRNDFFEHMMNGSKGTKMPRGDKNQILDFTIPNFDISTQKQIAKVLSDLDEKIEINNKINQELESMAKTLYDYWFVQFDFPAPSSSSGQVGKPYKSSGGKMVFNDELKREIPEGWEVKELQHISKCIMGQSPKGESYNKNKIGIPLLNGPADYENGALKGRTYTTSPTRLCEKNDMVLCIRATIGNLVYSEQEFCLGRGVAAVRPNEEKLSELVYYILLQEIERFKIQATGSIIRGITKDDLTESKCLIPCSNLLDKFHAQIKPVFDKIRINKSENQKLSVLRDWLLPMLMNGQVTIVGAEKEVESLGLVAEGKENYKTKKQ